MYGTCAEIVDAIITIDKKHANMITNIFFNDHITPNIHKLFYDIIKDCYQIYDYLKYIKYSKLYNPL